jgi:AbrB family looped-hinge helix DNA binding protein
MDFAVAKVSTKGQIVIPRSLRKDIHQGDQFLIIRDDKRIILKNMDSLASDIKDDIIFAEHVENAWLDFDKCKFVSKTKDEFLKELEKC